jgi:ribosomal protein S18 acetylase RimI-like enzyme
LPIGFALGYVLERVDGTGRMVCVYEIEVAEAHRRRGVGRRLVEQFKEIAASEGAWKMWVEVDPRNAPAVALYASTGGRPASESSVLYEWHLDGEAPGAADS